MLAKLGVIGTAVGFLISILEGLAELLNFFKENDENKEDFPEEIEEQIIELMLVLYDVLDEFVIDDMPVGKETFENFLTKVLPIVERILDTINVFR